MVDQLWVWLIPETPVPDGLEIYQWVIRQKFHRDQSNPSSLQALNDREELRLALDLADIIDELKMIHQLMDEQHRVLKTIMKCLNPDARSESGQRRIKNAFNPETCHMSGDFYLDNYLNASSASQGLIETGFSPETLYVGGNFHFNNYSNTVTENESQQTQDQAPKIESYTQKSLVEAQKKIIARIDQLDAMQKDAEDTYTQVLNLLDLKQKASSLAEARSTTRQGKAIMLFTIITIIFVR
ncbi:hypothetical protein N7488_009039 [Penicillium malachiteum]|nr:hypothetical protein N7488_009039 [Penicillium malachiteum]